MIKDLDSLPAFFRILIERIKIIIFIFVCLLYFILFKVMNFSTPKKQQQETDDTKYEILKLVDIVEYVPEPEPEPEPEPVIVPKEEIIQVEDQPEASEEIQEVQEVVKEIHEDKPVEKTEEQTAHNVGTKGHVEEEIDYLSQGKISVPPVIPTKEILSKIVYPPMAHRQGIQGVVYLELYIDQEGVIRKIVVLKDPGHGFAEAAVAAMEGIKCEPAQANGKNVPVRFRYPVKFTLK